MQMCIAQRSEITRWRHHARCASSQSAVDSGCLCAVCERVDRRQLSLSAQRIGRITMRVTQANNRLVVPLDYTIKQAHEPRVWNQRADFGFVDRDFLAFEIFHANSH